MYFITLLQAYELYNIEWDSGGNCDVPLVAVHISAKEE
jgi:hypothetical protein